MSLQEAVGIVLMVSPVTFGSWTQMKQDLSTMITVATNDSRTLSKVDMDVVNQYGCWCYFENDHGKGRGQPVNEIDEQCKILHDGYECAMHDAETEGFECVPWEIRYNSATGFGLGARDIDFIRQECDEQNTGANKCAQRACKVEGYFVVEMFAKFVSPTSIDVTKAHANGFDPVGQCPTSNLGRSSEHECCGVYPLRYPYKTYDSERQCCVSKTYNTNFLTCCLDGSVKMAC